MTRDEEGFTCWQQELSEQVADDAEDPLERIEAEDYTSRHFDFCPFAPCASRVVVDVRSRRVDGPAAVLPSGGGPETSGGMEHATVFPLGGTPDKGDRTDSPAPGAGGPPQSSMTWTQVNHWERICWSPDA